MDSWLRLLSYARPHRARLLVALLATVLASAATGLYAFLLGPLLEVLLTGEGASGELPVIRSLRAPLGSLDAHGLLTLLPIVLVVTALVRSLATAAQMFLMQTAGQRAVATIRRDLYGRILTLTHPWLDQQHSGDLLARFGADVAAVEFALTYAVASIVKDGAQLVTLLFVSAALDWRLLAAAVLAVPLAALPIAKFGRSVRRASDDAQRELGGIGIRAGEAIANVRIVQAYVQEDAELGRLDVAQDRYLAAMRRSFALRAAFTPVLEWLGVAALAAGIYFAGGAIASGALSGETLLSFLAALMLMYQPVKSLTGTWQQLSVSMAGARRIYEVLDAPRPPPDPADAPPLTFERELRLDHVSFGYGDRPVLDDVTIAVPRGQTVALVGESGAGKTTIGALLLRFYDPQGGAVTLDGRDVRSASHDALRRLVAWVPQEPVLFSGTVRDNVGCVQEGATDADIEQALEAAHAKAFVREMGGLGAEVGERGSRLSGGQRQRIALARAFLSGAPIILLDEATSALDPASEVEVQAGLARLLAERTAVVIAHRLSTVEKADRIVVLERGRVVEEGRHEALLAQRGSYARLHAAQLATQAEQSSVVTTTRLG